METLNPTNKQFTKEKFHKELINYLRNCPTPEKKSALQFLKNIYSINIYTLCTGDAIDFISDNIDIGDGDVNKASLMNFLITSQIRMNHVFSDLDSVMDNHLATLVDMISDIGVLNNSSDRIADSKLLKYIVLLRIYLDLNLMVLVEETYYDNSI